jgi:hypothetical protein
MTFKNINIHQNKKKCEQANKQTSQQASKQTSKQANKPTSQQATRTKTLKMEYSCYYYHSNDKTNIIIFVKKGDLIEVRFLNYYTYEDEYSDNDDNDDDNFSREFNMILTFEQLKELKCLYNYYQLSLLLTENINCLKYVKNINSDFMYGWAISSKKNWKGLYFTENYNHISHIFKNIPKEPIIDDINFNNTVINYYTNTYENKSFIDLSTFYMSKFITQEEKKIEKDLIQIEHCVAKENVKVILSSRVKQFINDDTYKIILSMLL